MNTKLNRKIRKLMVQGLSRKEAEVRAAHQQIKDWDQQARNAELVKTHHSDELGQVTIPTT